jgi:hypothetical protein
MPRHQGERVLCLGDNIPHRHCCGGDVRPVGEADPKAARDRRSPLASTDTRCGPISRHRDRLRVRASPASSRLGFRTPQWIPMTRPRMKRRLRRCLARPLSRERS